MKVSEGNEAEISENLEKWREEDMKKNTKNFIFN